MIANLAEKRRQSNEPYRSFVVISYGMLILLYGTLLVGGLLLQQIAIRLIQDPSLAQQSSTFFAPGVDPVQLIGGFAVYGTGIWLPALLGMVLLIPAVRRLLAHVLPIDAASPVHAVALAYIMLVVINLMITLGTGLGNLATTIEQQTAGGQPAVTLASLWAQQILTALLAIVGVGWLIRRDWASALQRLGIVKPSWRQVLFGVVLGLLLVPVVMLLERVSSLFQIGFDPNVEKLTEQLLGPLSRTLVGILTIGVAAALGEETLLRGAVQPRFGLELTAVVFALLHSTYGLSLSTLVVFLLGLVLGLVRNRANTSTSMIVHAVYNITLAVLAYLNVSSF
ncbi:MAG: CPBP family glutamic-type intramembrane protease [Chloroflexi bacterium]|nr:CPBP family glutamic-type intramembrane protease [Chloroflexota bacterium]